MSASPSQHLAQLNVGRLIAPPGDPAVAPFINAIDRVNGLAKRMPGFVWMMEGEGEGPGNTDNTINSDPRHIANLSVWESIDTLEAFVWNTVHRQFYGRRAEWFDAMEERHFVMWWVPQGHRPTLEEALERLDLLNREGPGPEAFGWADRPEARLWRDHACSHVG
ncbi:MAG: DUF3291 domain-containing protein [Pseudomonadota bacterium]